MLLAERKSVVKCKKDVAEMYLDNAIDQLTSAMKSLKRMKVQVKKAKTAEQLQWTLMSPDRDNAEDKVSDAELEMRKLTEVAFDRKLEEVIDDEWYEEWEKKLDEDI